MYYLHDGHGSVIRLTDESGDIQENYHYDAFGNEQRPSGSSTNPFRYCGEYFDKETGNLYLRARYYNSSNGRFTTEDPAFDGLNWYVYCSNDPVNFLDFSGLEQLVVSGSETDSDSRFKYNFIEPAIKKIQELKENAGDEQVTWAISTAGYSEKDLKRFQEIADEYGVTLVKFDSAAELQNYINSKSTDQWNLSKDRTNDKITKFTVFSHGVKGKVTLGLGQPNSNTLDLDKNWIGGVFGEAFNNPNSAFYSCNTGTGGDDSFAQAWVNQVGGRTWAVADGKTDYANMNQGESWLDKLNRAVNGFNTYGSRNYPTAGKAPAKFKNFYRK